MLPEIFIVFIGSLMIVVVILVLNILSNVKAFRSDIKKVDYVKKWSVVGVYGAALVILIGFFVPFFSKYFSLINFSANDASNASTFNGYVAPFVAVAAVITTGLAFFMQYQANEKLKEQIDKQDKQYQLDKFESQFYEMLRLHKENVNEMSIEGYDYNDAITDDAFKVYNTLRNDINEKNSNHKPNQDTNRKEIVGRKIFFLMVKEFHAMYCIMKKVYYQQLNSGMLNIDNEFVIEESDRESIFRVAYNIFFNGNEIFDKPSSRMELKSVVDTFNVKFLDKLIFEVKLIRACHKKGVRYLKGYIRKANNYQSLHIAFSYKPFGGHQIRLVHYYRHMFNLVKHVTEQSTKLLTYEEKRRYLMIFRGQLSNHEVVLLYYYWLSGKGSVWEQKEGNHFFTDYRMLYDLDQKLVLSEFDPLEIFNDDCYTNFLFEYDDKKKDQLFDLAPIESTITVIENKKRKEFVS